MQNKFLSKIVISFLALAFLLAPITPALQKQGGHLVLSTKTNTAEAETQYQDDFSASITTGEIHSTTVDLNITLTSKRNGAFIDYINAESTAYGGIIKVTNNTSAFYVQVSDKIDFSNIVYSDNPGWTDLGYTISTFAPYRSIGSITDSSGGPGVQIGTTAGGLDPEKTYYVRFMMKDKDGNKIDISTKPPSSPITFKTISSVEDNTATPKESGNWNNPNNPEFGCGSAPTSWFTNCIALLIYKIIYTPLASFTHLAAVVLDFFVYYSTNSGSYSSVFVARGWGAVRDIANIFFIIALLYIAIKTILSIGVSNNKKLIGAIVIVALLINFSLFFTEVIIDASNILAKVFYNNITPTDQNGADLKDNNAGGQKSVTIHLVDKFDPIPIFKDGGTIIKDNPGQFIFVTFLCIVLMIYMIYIFLSVALLFVGRVIALWLCMIFSPIAFISYTVPFKIPGFGHEEWWSELLKNAFLAPIFIFFL